MATEPADESDGSEVSVRLPSDLGEWLDERAAVLDVDRGELLVQLASAYRAAADLGDGSVAELAGDGVDPVTSPTFANSSRRTTTPSTS